MALILGIQTGSTQGLMKETQARRGRKFEIEIQSNSTNPKYRGYKVSSHGRSTEYQIRKRTAGHHLLLTPETAGI